ncbi:WhiB family transcriptional regulator [Nonomuraea basaltis]|uniref:WhiB family transcriptional regulator n=1 Tax=Nonomuraea basaltis TaxID=2495887 RepID=UPI00110C4902|nr:WhiB family transcriptional regulator [Nonomuraea basaltis]TMR88305.1 WhiB family transcriptional regulator [Nonomuraea basaltis]
MSWIHRAACRDVDPEIFFPIASPDTEAGEAAVAQAKQVCGGCSVRARCLNEAIESREPYGVWGGESESARRGLMSTAHRGAS